MSTVRWGILSTARHFEKIMLPAYRQARDTELAAVASRDGERAQAFARQHHIPTAHASYEALLDDPTIDAVYIPLPNNLHKEWAIKAAQAYSPDGQALASAGADLDDDTVRLWDTSAGRELISLLPPDRVNALAFSPDGRTLAAGSAAYVGLWGIPGGAGAAAALPGPTTAPALTPAPGQEALDPGYAQSGVEAEAVAPATVPAAGQGADEGCVVTARFEDINLRAGPDASYERVGTMGQGETDTAEGWATGPDGYTWWRLSGSGAWVRADLVTFPDVCFTLPPVRGN